MIDHCRRNDCTYAQTREFVIRETTLRMTEMAKEHNMVEHVKRNYAGKMQSEKMYTAEVKQSDEEVGEMNKVRANIRCYNC